MNDLEQPRLPHLVLASAKRALRTGLHRVWRVVRVCLPLTLAMALLQWSGILATLKPALDPVAALLGLPGEALIVVLASALFNLYGAVAVMMTLSLTLTQATILSAICLVAHSLAVETAQMRKAGSSAAKMIVLRLVLGLGLGLFYKLILPATLASTPFSHALVPEAQALGPILGSWLVLALRLVLLMGGLTMAMAILARVLEDLRILDVLAVILGPFMRFLGLPSDEAIFLLVINVSGYAAGGRLVAAKIQDGKMKPQEGDLFNHHAAVSHGLIEDTAIFTFLGPSLFWLIVPRLALAVAVTWAERIRRHYFRRSFRAGVA